MGHCEEAPGEALGGELAEQQAALAGEGEIWSPFTTC